MAERAPETTECASALAVERLGDPDRFWQLLKSQELFRVDLQRHQEVHFKWPLRHVSKREGEGVHPSGADMFQAT